MIIDNMKISIGAAIVALGSIATVVGTWTTLADDVRDNKESIQEIKTRSLSDSKRIQTISEEAVRAATERQFIREKVKENGAKLDRVLEELRRERLHNSP